MSSLFLIAKREFAVRARSKAFIILTLLMPAIMAAVIAMPVLLAQIKDSDVVTVGILDKTGLYAGEFRDSEQFHFVIGDADSLQAGIPTVTITGNLVDDPMAIKMSSHSELNPMLVAYVEGVINGKVYRDKMERFAVPELQGMINMLNERVRVQTVRVEENGQEQATSTAVNSASGYILATLIYIFMQMYGSMVLQSVLEEKTSRIVEIMVSSVRPVDLMMGKILGIFVLGLAQLLVWGLMFFCIMEAMSAITGGNSVQAGAFMSVKMAISSLPLMEMSAMLLVYFIGGYLLYAGVYAALGSSVSSTEEAQQFSSPMTMLLVFAFFAAIASRHNPSGTLAFWASMLPATSPMVMMVRVPFGVPAWELAVSVLLLFAAAMAMIWASARIYRTGILMYGKKPSFREMLKWLKYR